MILKSDYDRAIEEILAINSVYKDKQARSHEILLQKNLNSTYEHMLKAIMKQLSQNKNMNFNDSQIQAILRQIDNLQEEYIEVISNGKKTAAQLGQNRITRQLQLAGYNVPFTGLNSRVLDILNTSSIDASIYGLNTLKGDLRGILIQAYEEGIGHKEAGKIIEQFFGKCSDYKSNSIARTEINSAQNLGKHLEMETNALINFKEWWSALDERVRDGSRSPANHVDMHGQIVRVEDKYSNGLLYPGDKTGNIEEWIECRCTEIAFIMPRGFCSPNKPYFYENEIVRI